MKKMDIMIAAFFLIAGMVLALLMSSSSKADRVMIYVNGELYGEYNLLMDENIVIRQNGHSNTVRIYDGKVAMLESDCKNQICVHQGEIDLTGETICCLPNRVIISVCSEGDSEYDAITH